MGSRNSLHEDGYRDIEIEAGKRKWRAKSNTVQQKIYLFFNFLSSVRHFFLIFLVQGVSRMIFLFSQILVSKGWAETKKQQWMFTFHCSLNRLYILISSKKFCLENKSCNFPFHELIPKTLSSHSFPQTINTSIANPKHPHFPRETQNSQGDELTRHTARKMKIHRPHVLIKFPQRISQALPLWRKKERERRRNVRRWMTRAWRLALLHREALVRSVQIRNEHAGQRPSECAREVYANQLLSGSFARQLLLCTLAGVILGLRRFQRGTLQRFSGFSLCILCGKCSGLLWMDIGEAFGCDYFGE